MSQIAHRDLEGGNDPDGHRDHPQLTPNQPFQGGSNFGDSSGPLFSIYSKVAEEEDNKVVDRWQKDADGILIFTGLFSAAVAALLAVTVQDLRPNSQDTSAFYLGNIYEVLADPNVTRASIPSPAKPPPFSPPKYTVWVNSLWFLSLVMSLSCALWATSLHQWARRYIRLTQPARCSPEKRARMRAFFANGADEMGIPWAVEGLPTLLHLSLFLFFAGLVIFLFNVDQEVFTRVVWWIVLFSIVYGLITLLPLIRHDSPYNTPLSSAAWFLYARIQYVALSVLTCIITVMFGFIMISAFIVFKILSFVTSNQTERCGDQIERYQGQIWRYLKRGYKTWDRHLSRWMSGGVEKKAEETADEQSSEIDVRILGWTISALGDDDSLEKFFEAIPGFFSSKFVKDLEKDFPETHLKTFWGALNGFMGRTSTSNSVTESVRSRRDIICRDIISMIPCPDLNMPDNLLSHIDEAPVSIERLQAMARWFTHLSQGVSGSARNHVIWSLPKLQERDNRWITLASNACSLAAHVIERNVAMGGDNVLLATLICISRNAIHSDDYGILRLVEALTHFDIHHTLPGLQHDFCTLWNELVQEARNRGRFSTAISIVMRIRLLYITLHQGTDAVPTAFSASTDTSHHVLLQPSSYPFCDIASHRPDSATHWHAPVPYPRAIFLLTQPTDSESPDASPHRSTSGSNTASQQVKHPKIMVDPPSPPDPITSSEIGDNSQAPAATSSALPVHTSPHPTDTSPPSGVAAAPQDIPPAATVISEHLLHASMRAPTSTLTPAPAAPDELVLNKSMAACEAGAASTSNLLLPASSVVSFSFPNFPSSPIPPLPKTSSHSTGTAALPRLRARGLMNSGNMCFVNAVLHLLVHSPPFWDLFKELGDLKGQCRAEGPETGGGAASPLVDATVRFFEEFVFKEELPTMQQPLQLTARGKQREDEEKRDNKIVESFEPTYMYDAMKEKRLLKNMLDGKHENAEEFLGLYLDALDKELAELHTFISMHEPASAPGIEELKEQAQSAEGQAEAEVGVRDHTAGTVESPISRIFSGRSRSTIRAPSQPDTITIEAWRSLKLRIQPESVHTIQDALAQVSQPQPVQVGQFSSTEASQQVLLEALPPVLVLHLERFLYDAAADKIKKINKPVQFAPELEIPLALTGKSAEPVHYKLYGVLYHHGESAGSGHYTVDVLHPNGNCNEEGWLHIDDEAVDAVRHEDVFGSDDNERVGNQCAYYMLFYCRTNAWTR